MVNSSERVVPYSYRSGGLEYGNNRLHGHDVTAMSADRQHSRQGFRLRELL